MLAGFCFPPFDLGPLIVVALVPLLWAWHAARPRDAAAFGFVFGVGCYTVGLEWIRYFGMVAIVPLVAIMSLALAVVGFVVALLGRRGVRSPWLTAAAWVVVEALRGRWPLGGFPWADVGVALHRLEPARALAGLGGVLLISFFVVALAGLIADLAREVVQERPRRQLAAALVGLGVLVGGVAVADVTRYEPTPTGSLRFALLQGDDVEVPLAEQASLPLTERHLALADRLEGRYDLIVFPESALDTDPDQDPVLRDELTRIAAEHDAAVLVNARTPGSDDRSRNTNVLYEPSGRRQGEYSKQHLVPFGEYVPWRDRLGFIDELRQIPYDFEPGHRRVLFDVGTHRIGTVICFESAFGPLVRDYVRDGAEAIVVSTSNRSYRRSGNSEQHLALSSLRAAETGRPVLQASVSGISGVIDADGTVRDTTELFESAVVEGRITTTTGETPYVRFGEWVVLLCAIALVGATVFAVVRGQTAENRSSSS